MLVFKWVIFCLWLRLVEYGYQAFTSTIFCFGSGLLKSKLSSLLKSLGRGSIFSWKNEEGTRNGHSHKWAVCCCSLLLPSTAEWTRKSVPCLEKEEKAIPLFNTDNLNASGVWLWYTGLSLCTEFKCHWLDEDQVMTSYGQSCTDRLTRQSQLIFRFSVKTRGKASKRRPIFVFFGGNPHESCSYIMRIKGVKGWYARCQGENFENWS